MSKVWLIFCLLSIALAGCQVGPDYQRPQTPVDGQVGFVNVPDEWPDANDIVAAGPWWETFGDPVTAEYVRIAIANNYDLKAAAQRVIEAEALYEKSFGRTLPSLSYNASAARGKNIIGPGPGVTSEIYSHGLSARYTVDVFGKLKRAEQGAYADFLASEQDRAALRHLIVSQVVRSRVQVATNQRLLEIARADIDSRLRTLEIVDRRYGRGIATALEVHLARENLAAAKAIEPQIIQSLELAGHSLDVLLGRRPAVNEIPEDMLADLPDLSPVPVGLGADLLERRPDVRAAELRVAAATERVGVSIAEMYPDLTLTASGGYQADTLSKLLDSDQQVWSIAAGLVAPIFQGGQLKAQVKASKARASQAAEGYVSTVLDALREVEDALVKERTLKQRFEQLNIRFDEGKQAEELARQRYQNGLERLLIVLETERRRRLAENELAIAKAGLFNARIDLFLALGGDWGLE